METLDPNFWNSRSAVHGSCSVNPIAKAVAMLKRFQPHHFKSLSPWNKHKQQVILIKSITTGARNIVFFCHHILKRTDPIGLFKIRFYSCTLHHGYIVLCACLREEEVMRVTWSYYTCNGPLTSFFKRQLYFCVVKHMKKSTSFWNNRRQQGEIYLFQNEV